MNFVDLPAALASGHPAGIATVTAIAVAAYLRRWLRRMVRMVIVAGVAVLLVMLIGLDHRHPAPPEPTQVGGYR